MFPKTSLIALSSLLLLFCFDHVTGLSCYEGVGTNYYEVNCDGLITGQNWICGKIPELQGQEVRSCVPNPGQLLATGCYEYNSVEMCFCNTNLCNSARKSTSSILIPLILSAALVWWSRNFIKA